MRKRRSWKRLKARLISAGNNNVLNQLTEKWQGKRGFRSSKKLCPLSLVATRVLTGTGLVFVNINFLRYCYKLITIKTKQMYCELGFLMMVQSNFLVQLKKSGSNIRSVQHDLIRLLIWYHRGMAFSIQYIVNKTCLNLVTRLTEKSSKRYNL